MLRRVEFWSGLLAHWAGQKRPAKTALLQPSTNAGARHYATHIGNPAKFYTQIGKQTKNGTLSSEVNYANRNDQSFTSIERKSMRNLRKTLWHVDPP